MNSLHLRWFAVRRTLLKVLIPEWVWPRSVDLDGVRFPVRGMPLNFGTKRWIANGLYECDERNLIAPVVEPGITVVEMGGSLGVLARILAHKVTPNGRVVSIEASPELMHKAARWCPVPGNLQMVGGFAFPLYSAQGINVTGFHTDGSELDGRTVWALQSDHQGDVWDLARIERELGIQPDLLVVDIEGGEEVLRTQAAHFPKSLRHLVLEFHPRVYGPTGVAEITERLSQEGFDLAAASGMCARFSRTS